MKAILWTKYGPPDTLQLQEVERPIPKANEVLIKVVATTVTAGDCELRRSKGPLLFRLPMRLYIGLSRPQRITILGQELAGVIEAAGAEVTRYRKGDQVFAWTGLRLGAYAEYTCLPEDHVLAVKPPDISFDDAAVLPVGGLEAVHFLKKVNLRRGEKVLINGAGGSIGTFAIQLARYFGAEVTAVDSAGKLDMLRAIGAAQVIDYAQEDYTQRGERYDVIYDVIGKGSFSRSLSLLNENGRYLLGNPGLSQMVRGRQPARSHGRQVLLWDGNKKPEDVSFLLNLMEAGKIKPVIDRRYPLEQIAEAHRYVETGQKKGNVVITVA